MPPILIFSAALYLTLGAMLMRCENLQSELTLRIIPGVIGLALLIHGAALLHLLPAM